MASIRSCCERRAAEGEEDQARARHFLFYAFTGLRRQEALDLAWQDVHLQEQGEPLHVHVRRGKRDKARLVPLIPEAVDALGEIKDMGPVFRQVSGGRVSHVFKVAATDAGLGWFRLHGLRHTADHLLAEEGVEGRLIQDVLGVVSKDVVHSLPVLRLAVGS